MKSYLLMIIELGWYALMLIFKAVLTIPYKVYKYANEYIDAYEKKPNLVNGQNIHNYH